MTKLELRPSASQAQNCRQKLWAQGDMCMYVACVQSLMSTINKIPGD